MDVTDQRAPQQALYETLVSWRAELGSQGGLSTTSMEKIYPAYVRLSEGTSSNFVTENDEQI